MKLLKWVQFTWDLADIADRSAELPKHYTITPAGAADEMALRKVLSTSFLLDPAWNPAVGQVMQTIQGRIDAALATESQTFLALRHGARIIGAALLQLDPALGENLAIGPAIYSEYRNRGFGTLLLNASLVWLRDAGVTRATAIAPDYVPVTRFLYPKFGSSAQPLPGALLAA